MLEVLLLFKKFQHVNLHGSSTRYTEFI